MALPRTRTFEMHDVVLSGQIDVASAGGTLILPCPIDGYVERVMVCRGGGQVIAEAITMSVDGGTNVNMVTASNGAARDVDTFETTESSDLVIAAGRSISLVFDGNPFEGHRNGVAVVVRGR